MEKGLAAIGKTVWYQEGITVSDVKIVGWDGDRFIVREDGYFNHFYRSVDKVFSTQAEAEKARNEYAERMYAIN